MNTNLLLPPGRHLVLSAFAGDVYGNRDAVPGGINLNQPVFAYDDAEPPAAE